jgi:hypothetical protein
MSRDESQHIDFVKHDWHGLKEELVERLPADDPRAGKHGDYAHYSEPHSMKDCPFASEQKLAVEPGNGRDVCPFCGIFRRNAGFNPATCGDGYLRPGCFVVQTASEPQGSRPKEVLGEQKPGVER